MRIRDVKRGQILEAEVEAEAITLRSRFEVEAEARTLRSRPRPEH